MTIRLNRRRCRKCEGPVHWVNNNLYCNRCGAQPPTDRAGNPIVSRETSGEELEKEPSMSDLETELFNKELMCCLLKVVVEYDMELVKLMLYPNNCTDMTGAINFSKRLMPNVRTIQTISGRIKETVYILEDSGWKAHSFKCFT